MKKTLAILCALALFVALFAGCSGSSGSATTAATTAAATTAAATTAAGTTAAGTTAADTTAAATTAPSAEGGLYPISSEPVTYTALAASSSSMADDWNDYTAMKYWSEYTNVYFDWQYISNTDWETQINLKLAGDDLTEVIWSALTTAQLQTYGSEGGYFLNYMNYVDEYMPNMAAAFADHPEIK